MADLIEIEILIADARAVSECKENSEKDGPCGACLEKLDDALEALDAAEHTYTCQHCGISSRKGEWGPGHVRCPRCGKVALSASETYRAEVLSGS